MNLVVLIFTMASFMTASYQSIRSKSMHSLIIGFFTIGWVIGSGITGFSYGYLLQIVASILAILHTLSLKTYYWDGLITAFIGLNIIMFANLEKTNSSLQGLVRFTFCSILIYYLGKYSKMHSIHMVISILNLGLISQIFCVFFKIGGIVEYATGNIRFGGIFGHPNYASYMASISFLMYLNSVISSSIKSKYHVFYLGIPLVVILTTNARSSFISLIVGILMILLLRNKKSIRTKINFKNKFYFILIFLVLTFFSSGVRERLSEYFVSGGIHGQNSVGWRILQWKEVTKLAMNGGLFGYGWHSTEKITNSGLAAHNYFLQAWLELGFIGLIISVFIFMVIARKLIRNDNMFLVPVLITSSIVDAGLFFPALFFMFTFNSFSTFSSKSDTSLPR